MFHGLGSCFRKLAVILVSDLCMDAVGVFESIGNLLIVMRIWVGDGRLCVCVGGGGGVGVGGIICALARFKKKNNTSTTPQIFLSSRFIYR